MMAELDARKMLIVDNLVNRYEFTVGADRSKFIEIPLRFRYKDRYVYIGKVSNMHNQYVIAIVGVDESDNVYDNIKYVQSIEEAWFDSAYGQPKSNMETLLSFVILGFAYDKEMRHNAKRFHVYDFQLFLDMKSGTAGQCLRKECSIIRDIAVSSGKPFYDMWRFDFND